MTDETKTTLFQLLTSVVGDLYQTEENILSAPLDKGVIVMNFAVPYQVKFSFDGPERITERISEMDFSISTDSQYKFLNNKWVYTTADLFKTAMRERLKDILGYNSGLEIGISADEPKENATGTVASTSAKPAFYCFNCGGGLSEPGMGFYNCRKCKSTFLPYKNDGAQCMQLVDNQ